MNAGITLCFYLVIGMAVAVALWISDSTMIGRGRWFGILTALVFWPLYLPVLLVSQRASQPADDLLSNEIPAPPLKPDEMAMGIVQVEAELDTALSSLHDWADPSLLPASDKFAELHTAWRQQADRVRELDRLLLSSSSDSISLDVPASGASESATNSASANRILESERSRNENLQKLRLVRQQCYNDLMATLAWVRQLVMMIHVARYTGAPASRAAELVQQIANAVEGLPVGSD